MGGTATIPITEPDLVKGRRRPAIRPPILVGFLGSVLGVFLVFVLAGLFGFFGVRTAHAQATASNGVHVELTYPRIARPALAISFAVHMTNLERGKRDGVVRVRRPYPPVF